MTGSVPRVEGMVTEYFQEKGYGFVTTVDLPDEDTTDVFFHITDIPGHNFVNKRWRLEFSPEYNDEEGGWEAKNIRIISKKVERPESVSRTNSRKPWYQREEARNAAESTASSLGVKQTTTIESEDDDDESGPKYDPRDHV